METANSGLGTRSAPGESGSLVIADGKSVIYLQLLGSCQKNLADSGEACPSKQESA